MQLADLNKGGPAERPGSGDLDLSAAHVNILSDLTQSALNQEKKLL